MSAATVYVPTSDENALPFVETPAGRCVPVFSSLEALAAHRPEGGRYVRLPRAALSALCPADVGVLLDGRVALTAEAASELTAPLVGVPHEEPEALLAAVQAFARDRPEVRAVRHATVVLPTGEPGTCVGFETAPDVDERALLEEAAAAVRRSGFEGVLFAPLGEGGELARRLVSREA